MIARILYLMTTLIIPVESYSAMFQNPIRVRNAERKTQKVRSKFEAGKMDLELEDS